MLKKIAGIILATTFVFVGTVVSEPFPTWQEYPDNWIAPLQYPTKKIAIGGYDETSPIRFYPNGSAYFNTIWATDYHGTDVWINYLYSKNTASIFATGGQFGYADSGDAWIAFGSIDTNTTYSASNGIALIDTNFTFDGLLNEIGNPDNDTTFVMGNNTLTFTFSGPVGADGAFEIDASGGFSGDLVHIHQHTGNPSSVDLLHLEADDADVIPLKIISEGTQPAIITFGGVYISNGITNGAYIQFDPSSLASLYDEGKLFYDSTSGALAFYNDEADITLQIGQEVYYKARNASGATIDDGMIVYIDGATGEVPNIRLAEADDVATTYVLGMTTHQIEDGTDGYVTTIGVVHDIDTSLYAAGDRLYLDDVTAGNFTDVRPSIGSRVIEVGYVVAVGTTNGSIVLHSSNEDYVINDTYGATWDGVTGQSSSANAVHDILSQYDSDYDGVVDSVLNSAVSHTGISGVSSTQHHVPVTALDFTAITGSATDSQIPDDITVTAATISGTITSLQIADDMARDSELHAKTTSLPFTSITGTLEGLSIGANGVTINWVLAADGANGTAWKEDATGGGGGVYYAGIAMDLATSTFNWVADTTISMGSSEAFILSWANKSITFDSNGMAVSGTGESSAYAMTITDTLKIHGAVTMSDICSTNNNLLTWGTDGVLECVTASGGGDMFKSVYDADNSSAIDYTAGGVPINCVDGEAIQNSGGSSWICTVIAAGSGTGGMWTDINSALQPLDAGYGIGSAVTPIGPSFFDTLTVVNGLTVDNVISTADTKYIQADNSSAPTTTFLGVGYIWTLNGEPYVAVDGTIKNAIAYSGMPSVTFSDTTMTGAVVMPAICSTNSWAVVQGASGLGCVELTGGAEVNNLEAVITGIELGEIFYGTGTNAGAYTAHNFSKIADSIIDAQVPDDITILSSAISGNITSAQIAADMARDSELFGGDFTDLSGTATDGQVPNLEALSNGAGAGSSAWVLATDGVGNSYWKLDATGGGGANSFETWDVENGTDPVASSATDTIRLLDGTGITITGNATADSITIAFTGNFADIADSVQDAQIVDSIARDIELHTQGTDTALGAMVEDIDMNTLYQLIALAAPVGAGEAVRTTTNITEVNLIELTDASETTLHSHAGGGTTYNAGIAMALVGTTFNWVADTTISMGSSEAFVLSWSNKSITFDSNGFAVSGTGESSAYAMTITDTLKVHGEVTMSAICSTDDNLVRWNTGGDLDCIAAGSGAGGLWTDINSALQPLDSGYGVGSATTPIGSSFFDTLTVINNLSVGTITSTASTKYIQVDNATAPTGTFLGIGYIITIAGEPKVAVDGTNLSAFYHSTNLLFGSGLSKSGNTLTASGGSGLWTDNTTYIMPNDNTDDLGATAERIPNIYADTLDAPTIITDYLYSKSTASIFATGGQFGYTDSGDAWVSFDSLVGGGGFSIAGTNLTSSGATVSVISNPRFTSISNPVDIHDSLSWSGTDTFIIYEEDDVLTQRWQELQLTSDGVNSKIRLYSQDGYAGESATMEIDGTDGIILLNPSVAVQSNADIDLTNSSQVVNLQAPAALGEAIRQTANVTETNLNTLTGGGDTTLHDHDGILENITHRGSDGTDHSYIDQDVTTSGTPAFLSISANSVAITTATIDSLNLGSVCSTDQYHLVWNTDNSVSCVSAAGGGDMNTATYDVGANGFIDQAAGGTELDTSGVTNGQMLIGNTTSNVWNLGTISGTANEIGIAVGGGSLQVSIVASPILDATNITGGDIHTQGTDTALGAMAEDIDMNTLYQLISLAAPVGVGEAVRTTTNITEVNLIELTNASETTLHSHAGGGSLWTDQTGYILVVDDDNIGASGDKVADIFATNITSGAFLTDAADGDRFIDCTNTNNVFTTTGYLCFDITDDELQYYDSDSMESVPKTSDLHTQGTDTTLGTMTADIDMNNLFQIVNLQTPAALGEALRQTANVTETNLNTLTGGGDTTLHDHDGVSENTTHRGSDGSDHSLSHAQSHDNTDHSTNYAVQGGAEHDNFSDFVGAEHLTPGDGLVQNGTVVDVVKQTFSRGIIDSVTTADVQIPMGWANGSCTIDKIVCRGTTYSSTITVYNDTAAIYTGLVCAVNTPGSETSQTSGLANTSIADGAELNFTVTATGGSDPTLLIVQAECN